MGLKTTSLAQCMGMLLLAATLTACASTRLVDSEVKSFGASSATVMPATYQFERLPSQQADAAAQQNVEAMAIPVLQRLGLDLASETPTYTVELSLVTDQVLRQERAFPRLRPWMPGASVFGPSPMNTLIDPVYNRFQVRIVLRDAVSRQVVYESSARHVGPWRDQAQIFPAVLFAAMRDFPAGGPGERSITVEVGSGGMELRQ